MITSRYLISFHILLLDKTRSKNIKISKQNNFSKNTSKTKIGVMQIYLSELVIVY